MRLLFFSACSSALILPRFEFPLRFGSARCGFARQHHHIDSRRLHRFPTLHDRRHALRKSRQSSGADDSQRTCAIPQSDGICQNASAANPREYLIHLIPSGERLAQEPCEEDHSAAASDYSSIVFAIAGCELAQSSPCAIPLLAVSRSRSASESDGSPRWRAFRRNQGGLLWQLSD